MLQLIECGRSDTTCLLKGGHKMLCSFPLVAWNTPSLNVPPPNTAVMLGEVQATWRGHVLGHAKLPAGNQHQWPAM